MFLLREAKAQVPASSIRKRKAVASYVLRKV